MQNNIANIFYIYMQHTKQVQRLSNDRLFESTGLVLLTRQNNKNAFSLTEAMFAGYMCAHTGYIVQVRCKQKSNCTNVRVGV